MHRRGEPELRLAPHVGKALIAVAIAIAVYQVVTADDMVGEAIKQGAGVLGFWAGAKVGAAACGPGAPACAVIGGLAFGVLGALLAEEAAEHGYNAIKG